MVTILIFKTFNCQFNTAYKLFRYDLTIFRENHQKLLLLGRINSMEGNLTVSYQNIIRFFTEEKVLEQQSMGGRKSIIKMGDAFETIHEFDQKLYPQEQLISN